jgi:hypothetical protein
LLSFLIEAAAQIFLNIIKYDALYFEGSFANSEIAGLYLTGLLGINYSFISHLYTKEGFWCRGAACVLVVASVLMILFSHSRTALVCLFTMALYLIWKKSVIRRRSKFFPLLFFFAFAVFLLVLAFFFKQDSSLGRILVWKISLSNISKYLFSGVGIDKFSSVYNIWQGEYFLNHIGSLKERYLANDSFYAYNEFIQLAVEFGLIPFAVGLFYSIYHLLAIRRQIYFPVKLFLLCIGISCISFYTLHIPSLFVLLIFAIALSAGSSNTIFEGSAVFRQCNIIKLCRIVVLTFIVSVSFVLQGAYRNWNAARIEKPFDYRAALARYSMAAKYLNSQGEFMIELAEFEGQNGNFREAIECSDISARDKFYQFTYLIKAISYDRLKIIDSSGFYYERAISVVPNKAVPKYLTMLYYERQCNSEEASKWASSIINDSTKNSSNFLFRLMKDSAESFLVSKKFY